MRTVTLDLSHLPSSGLATLTGAQAEHLHAGETILVTDDGPISVEAEVLDTFESVANIRVDQERIAPGYLARHHHRR